MSGTYRYLDGQIRLSQADEDALIKQVRGAAIGQNVDEMKAFGNLLAAPIETIANYEEWNGKLFSPKSVQPGEDWKIPLRQYAAKAYTSSPDGRVRRTRVGITYTRPTFSTIRTGFEMGWSDLENATWNIMGMNIKDVGTEISRVRDQMAFGVISTAVNAVGHVVNTTGGQLTRTSVDAIFKNAAAIGFPIRRVIANPATLQDMRSAQFWTWETPGGSTVARSPIGLASPSYTDELLTKGYIGNYSGAEWFEAIGLSSGTQAASSGVIPITAGAAIIIYAGAPEDNGYTVTRGGVRQVSDVNMDTMSNRYMYDETRFFYVGNAYRLWVQIITP